MTTRYAALDDEATFLIERLMGASEGGKGEE